LVNYIYLVRIDSNQNLFHQLLNWQSSIKHSPPHNNKNDKKKQFWSVVTSFCEFLKSVTRYTNQWCHLIRFKCNIMRHTCRPAFVLSLSFAFPPSLCLVFFCFPFSALFRKSWIYKSCQQSDYWTTVNEMAHTLLPLGLSIRPVGKWIIHRIVMRSWAVNQTRLTDWETERRRGDWETERDGQTCNGVVGIWLTLFLAHRKRSYMKKT